MKKLTKDEVIELVKFNFTWANYITAHHDTVKIWENFPLKESPVGAGTFWVAGGLQQAVLHPCMVEPWYDNWQDSLIEIPIFAEEKKEPRVGYLCEFSDYESRETEEIDFLENIDKGADYPYESAVGYWKYCKEFSQGIPGYVKESEVEKLIDDAKDRWLKQFSICCGPNDIVDDKYNFLQWKPLRDYKYKDGTKLVIFNTKRPLDYYSECNIGTICGDDIAIIYDHGINYIPIYKLKNYCAIPTPYGVGLDSVAHRGNIADEEMHCINKEEWQPKRGELVWASDYDNNNKRLAIYSHSDGTETLPHGVIGVDGSQVYFYNKVAPATQDFDEHGVLKGEL